MNKTGIILIVTLVVFALFTFFSFKNTYNKIVELEESVNKNWSQVENQYQRRMDLIPNLVNTVKGAVTSEKDILESVVKARATATSVNVDASKLSQEQITNFQQAQDGLSTALGRLMVIVEKYPELQSIQGFSDLRVQLEGTENRISVERRNFNETVGIYNTYIRKFPNNVYAGFFGFSQKGYFKSSVGAENAPEVKF
ncbi:MAG: LemA family protein [Cytophagales bacterium]